MMLSLGRRAASEFIATAFLLMAVVGSGIMAQSLAGGNVALALLANAIATGGALLALILAFGPVSGAHMNPVVSLADAIRGGIRWLDAAVYTFAQCAGSITGVVAANRMFGLPLISVSTHIRTGSGNLLGEFLATFGLLAIVWGASRGKPSSVPVAVAAYITGAYWFTSSTSFANPAVTLARALSNTFAGIRPSDVLPFILAQLAGGLAATFLFAWISPSVHAAATDRLSDE